VRTFLRSKNVHYKYIAAGQSKYSLERFWLLVCYSRIGGRPIQKSVPNALSDILYLIYPRQQHFVWRKGCNEVLMMYTCLHDALNPKPDGTRYFQYILLVNILRAVYSSTISLTDNSQPHHNHRTPLITSCSTVLQYSGNLSIYICRQ
jgi:hypothetical protein